MNYVIFDLEATCWDYPTTKANETIEIGAVLINEEKQIISEFQRFVKPYKNPILSEFCTSLTSITQQNVDEAKYFYEVIEDFKNWFDCQSNDYLLCSWGFYDKTQLKSDCTTFQLDDAWLKRHISVKHQYTKIAKLRRHVGMQKALAHEGLRLEGTHHRGIDDAKNIAKIFLNHFGKWRVD